MNTASVRARKSLAVVFGRKGGRTLIIFSLAVIALFTGLVANLLSDASRRSADALADLTAAVLVPGANGDLSKSVDRLRQRFPRLIAVAMLDSSGVVRRVYPERPAHRRAVQQANAAVGESVVVDGPENGLATRVRGVVTSLNGSSSPFAQRAMMLFSEPAYSGRWFYATVMLGGAIILMAILCSLSMRSWVTGRIAQPLRQMARATREERRNPSDRFTLRSGGCRETDEIAAVIEDLMQGVDESEARARRVERESKHTLRKRELGFDRELRRAKKEAFTDGLTRLRNRTFLKATLESLFDCQQAEGADLAVVMIDIDNFKPYNDKHGHLVGDALLRFVGSLLKTVLRPSDHAVRFGGDEFLLLLSDTGAESAQIVATRLIKLFGQYTARFGNDPCLSMSAGVASIRLNRPSSSRQLISFADEALYTVKRKRKGSAVVSGRVADEAGRFVSV